MNILSNEDFVLRSSFRIFQQIEDFQKKLNKRIDDFVVNDSHSNQRTIHIFHNFILNKATSIGLLNIHLIENENAFNEIFKFSCNDKVAGRENIMILGTLVLFEQ